jgi:hypothetical protein
MNTCMYSVDVCMFVNVLLIRISLSIIHIIQTCYNTTRVCVDTHTQRRSGTCAYRIKCIVRG